jgi:hypothetical protein
MQGKRDEVLPPEGHLQLIVVGLSIILTARATRAVKLGSNGVSDVGELLELLVKVFSGSLGSVGLQPVLGLLDSLHEALLVIVVNLATKTLLVIDLVLQAIGVVLKFVARLDALTVGLVLLGILLSFLDHTLDVFVAEAALVVGDGDGLGLSSALVDSGDLKDTVGVKLEGDLDLGNTTGRRAASMLVISHQT